MAGVRFSLDKKKQAEKNEATRILYFIIRIWFSLITFRFPKWIPFHAAPLFYLCRRCASDAIGCDEISQFKIAAVQLREIEAANERLTFRGITTCR